MAATPTFRAGVANILGSNNIQVPAATQTGDYVLTQLAFQDNPGTIGLPAGWVLLAGPTAVPTSPRRFVLLGWRATSGGATVHAITPQNGQFQAGGVVTAWAGVDATSPVDVVSAVSSTFTAPGVTITGLNRRLIYLAQKSSVFNENTDVPPGMTKNLQVTPNFAHYVASEDRPSPGATGDRTSPNVNGPDGVGGSVLIALASVNSPPNAPTLVGPVGGQTIDRALDLVLDHDFSDPDIGDSQSARETRWRLTGAALWTSTGKIASTATAHTIPGGTLAFGDYEWQARTYDAQGAEGTWSGSEFFSAGDAPASPTITSSVAEGGTVPSETYTETWSTPVQDSAQWRVVADVGGLPDTSTVVASGSVDAAARSVAVPYPDNDTWRHFQLRVEDEGLFSPWVSRRRLVSYTRPPVPTVTLTTDDAAGAISATVGSPAPGPGEPSVIAFDLFRRLSAEGGDGIRIAAGVPAGTVVDRTPASGVEHDYRVKALGDNGTSSLSAWTDDATPVVVDPGGGTPGGYSGGY